MPPCPLASLDDEARIPVKTLAQIAGVDTSTVWRWAKSRPDFPKPQRLSLKATRWRVGDVRTWLSGAQR